MDPEYLIMVTKETYNSRVFQKMSLWLEGAIRTDEFTSEEMHDHVSKYLEMLATSTRSEESAETVNRAFQMIEDIQSGKTVPYWSTGSKRFDQIVALGPRKIIMVAAQKKIGKSRFVIDRMMHVMNNHPDLQIIWFTFEMRPEEVIMNQISWITGLDTRLLQGKLGPMSPEQLQEVRRTKKALQLAPIKWVNQRRTIDQIVKDMHRWVKGPTIMILDNVGLVETLPGRTDIQNEDEIAKRMVQMRDELDLCIIPVHHLSKESESRFNKDDLYRPKVTHVRGSSRLVDYSNELLLLHRPGHYKDLADVYGPQKWAEIQDKFLCDVPINRDGPEGEINFRHEIFCSSFYEL